MKKLLVIMMFMTTTLMMQSFTTVNNPVVKKGVEKSTVEWKAYKVTGSHYGTVDLKSGELEFDGDELMGGRFVMDMTSIECLDLTGDYKAKLEGHLRSDDFFSSESFNDAMLVITNVERTGKNSYDITADLTIKGIKNSVTFPASIYGNKANASIKVDRTKYAIKYGSGSYFSGLQDNLIYDEFDLVIDLEF